MCEQKSLIEQHNEFDEFAKYHHNKGGQEAHKLVKDMWQEIKSNPIDGSNKGIIRYEGFSKAFDIILKELHNRFVP